MQMGDAALIPSQRQICKLSRFLALVTPIKLVLAWWSMTLSSNLWSDFVEVKLQ